MQNSRFFGLNDDFLIEWIYGDLSDAIDVSQSGFSLIKNEYLGNTNSLVSSPGSEELVRNVLDNQSVLIDTTFNKWAYLNQDIPLPYNDFDPKIQKSDLSFSFDYSIIYDRIRLHISSGYDFPDIDGFIFEIRIKDKAGRVHNLSNITYLKSDEWVTINPDDFLIGEVLYSNYVEFRIPSLYHLLVQQNTQFPSAGDTLGKQLTDGIGISSGSQIDVRFHTILKTETEPVRNHNFFQILETKEISVPRQDEFSDVSASIEKAPNGDYFQLSAKYQESNIEDFIAYLNLIPDSDWIIIHSVEVYENLGLSEVRPSFPLSIVQTSEFENPITFRPVIFNSGSAHSWRIAYGVRLVNRVTNESIVKVSQKIYNDPQRWGKDLTKIDLGISPSQETIYNYILDNKYVPIKSNPVSTSTVQYVPVFIDKGNLLANYQPAQVDPDNGGLLTNSLNGISGKEQGELIFNLNPTDSFYQFTITKQADEELVPLDLSKFGTIWLNFINNAGERLRIRSFEPTEKDLKIGKVIFRIDDSKAVQIIGFSDKSFYITIQTGAGDETTLFSGTWTDSKTFNQNRSDANVNNLISQERTLKSSINSLNIRRSQIGSELSSKQREINNLEIKRSQLFSDIEQLQSVKEELLQEIRRYSGRR